MKKLAFALAFLATPAFAEEPAPDIDGSAVPASPTGPSDQPNRPIIIPRPQSGTSSNLAEAC